MSPRLRRLSGRQVVAIFEQFGFVAVSQKGSHAKLRRMSAGIRQTLTVPIHDEMDTGTLRSILRQASRYVPEVELRDHFYSE